MNENNREIYGFGMIYDHKRVTTGIFSSLLLCCCWCGWCCLLLLLILVAVLVAKNAAER
jgi:hypothetical protein